MTIITRVINLTLQRAVGEEKLITLESKRFIYFSSRKHPALCLHVLLPDFPDQVIVGPHCDTVAHALICLLVSCAIMGRHVFFFFGSYLDH